MQNEIIELIDQSYSLEIIEPEETIIELIDEAIDLIEINGQGLQGPQGQQGNQGPPGIQGPPGNLDNNEIIDGGNF